MVRRSRVLHPSREKWLLEFVDSQVRFVPTGLKMRFGHERAAAGRERRPTVRFLQMYPEKRLFGPAATSPRPKTRVRDCSEFPHPDVLVLP